MKVIHIKIPIDKNGNNIRPIEEIKTYHEHVSSSFPDYSVITSPFDMSFMNEEDEFILIDDLTLSKKDIKKILDTHSSNE